jgi:hypothetical protein
MAESKKPWGLDQNDFAAPVVPPVVGHPWLLLLLGLGGEDALRVRAYHVELRCGRVDSAVMRQNLSVVGTLLR